MRAFVRKGAATTGLAGVLEKIEILRASIRWAAKSTDPQIDRLLAQCNDLREEATGLLHAGWATPADAADLAPVEPLRPNNAPAPRRSAERRQALLDRQFAFDGVFGESPRLLDTLEMAERAAPTDLPVLVQGESGTGKELLAKVVHANGLRGERPFVSVNCGAIPENLIESELFGHRKGAFTGANSDRKGKFESADGGTIFLDEVGELPLSGQVKLLRVLQSHEIQRVGADQPVTVDTRVVAATNRDLLEMARSGAFREDLYYRLSVIQLTLPPLRDRRDEIPVLLSYFLEEAADALKREPVMLAPPLRAFLMRYQYPGNIRELRNLVFRLSCLADETAEIRHLPEDIRDALGNSAEAAFDSAAEAMTLADVKRAAGEAAERQYLEEGLRAVNGKVVELAKRLDLNRTHVQMLLKKHGLRSKAFKKTS